jgi:large subunit ribosomal protein L23
MTVDQYDVVRFPLVTEKSNDGVSANKYTFCVNKKSGKIQIKKSIETIYNVRVEKVNIIMMPRKKKKYRFRIEGYKPGYKKVVVTLKEGDKIAIT